MRLYTIRLRRVGRWNRPVYNIVVSFSDTRLTGVVFEKIGFYSPATMDKFFFINFERLAYWLMRGARPTYRVSTLFGKLFPSNFPATKTV